MIYAGRQTVFNHLEQYSLVRIIENEEEIALNKREEGKSSFSLRLAKYLFTSGIGDLLEVINVILSLAMTFLFAIDSYYYPTTPGGINIIEFILILFFIAHFALNIYTSENKFLYAFAAFSIVEYISIVPTFLVKIGTMKSNEVVILSKIFRFVSVGKLDRVLARHSKEVVRHIFKLIFGLLCIMMFGTAFLLVLERQNAIAEGLTAYQFHDWFYFMVVTVATVGFGDVSPRTSQGQIIIMASILALLALLPTLSNGLARVINLQSKYARASYRKQSHELNHILLLGKAEVEAFRTFLTELYHVDHGDIDTQTIIMQPNSPNDDMHTLLKSQTFQGKVNFIEGNALVNKDLYRAAADSANCVIILANKYSFDPQAEDYRNILQTYAVKQYTKSILNREIRVCLQVLKPENKELFTSSLNYGQHDQVVCVDELKLYLLAKTCVCPGINTIISPLITSSTPAAPTNPGTWIYDYLSGLQNEIYRIPFDPDKFSGVTFSTVAQHIYQEFDIILFALEVKVSGIMRVFLNPSDYIFQDIVQYGYVIAGSLPDIEKISRFRFPDHVERTYNFPHFFNKHHNEPDDKGRKKYTPNTRDEEQNEQELKMKNFYIGKINSLENATLNGVDDPKFENHIIICGIVPGMRHLLLPLRTRSLKTIHPVIILYSDPMPTNIWKQINRFPKVHFMQGSPYKLQDLDKACIQKALAVIILSKHTDQDSNNTTMADADTIFIYKTIKSCNPNIRIITELTSTSTISFLSHTKNEYMQKYGYIASEPFASGEIYISTMLDTLICQAYYNPFIISILDQLIMGNINMSYKLRKQCSQLRLNSCTLFIMNVPVKFIDKNFGFMFEILITDSKMVAIGLYREKVKGTSKYVFIKPQPDTKLSAKDKVFVLSYKQPKNAEMANLEEEEQMNLAKNLADGLSINIKSKLGGEEGKLDTDVARELLKVNQEIRGIIGDLKNINHDVFSKGFTNNEFVPDVRKMLRNELGEFSNI